MASNAGDTLETVFLTQDKTRLRAGWRLFGQWLLFAIVATLLAGPLFGSGVLGIEPTPRNLFVGKVAELIALIVSLVVARAFLDRRPLADLGVHWNRRAAVELVTGSGIAAVMVVNVFVLLLASTWLRVDGFAWATRPAAAVAGESLLMALNFALIAAWDELQVRGYILQNIEEGLNLPAAVLLSSAYLPILHLTNPAADLGTALGIFMGGVFFAYAYVVTRQLWLPIGLHFGWNFFLNTVFGFQLSGLATGGWVEQSLSGPPWLTGGAAGIEAGTIMLPAFFLGGWLIYAYTKRTQR